MKTTKSKIRCGGMLTILVLALGLMVCLPRVSEAAPMGTAFTYQGRLIDANEAADGLYDFEFKLFDDPCTGTQQGGPIDVNDLDVIDGSFTLELDFGPDIFTGYARWLETAIRPGNSIDANDFVTLSPRQELTPTPYALGVRVPLKLEGALENVSAIEARNTVLYSWPTQVTSSFEAAHADDRSSFGVKGTDVYTGASIDWSNRYGGYFMAEGVPGSDCFGESGGCSFAYGVYGKATGADYSYGGYFEGDYSAVWGQNGWYPNCVGALGISGDGDPYGVYGRSMYTSGAGVFGHGYTGVRGSSSDTGGYENYGGYFTARGALGTGVHGEATKSGNYTNYGGYFTAAGTTGMGVYGEHNSSGNYGYLADENGGAYGKHYSSGNFGVLGNSGSGVMGISASGDYGVWGVSGPGYGVYGWSNTGHGIHGFGIAVMGGYAGYFEGNVYVTGNVSAQSFTDRTPYPKDLATAYQAVMSMERLPGGLYQEHNKAEQLDHSKLSDFIHSEDGNRDLSATVSAHNEVLKDLIKKVRAQAQLMEMQNMQIQHLIDTLQETKQQLQFAGVKEVCNETN